MALSVVVVEELAEAEVGPFLAAVPAESELDRDKSLAARWCRNIASLHQTNMYNCLYYITFVRLKQIKSR